jgi:oxygen-independent coproporphyrinogen-3 oxidase
MDLSLNKSNKLSNGVSLYFHFPFCLKKCLYCSFISMENGHLSFDEYVDALVREMQLCRENLTIPFSAATLYIGGGTPSLMDPHHVEKIIDGAAKYFATVRDAEITIEANPGTLTKEKLAGYRSCGINRLSLGVQSLNDSVLEKLGRIHSSAQAVESFRVARQNGYANVGMDLINCIPGQSISMWKNDIRSAISLGPEHISVYGLSIEEGTPFMDMEKSGELILPDEEEAAVMYEKTSELLCGSGYEHYEISNFAKTGFRSRHNQVYWQRENYIGFGVGSHSFLKEPGFGMRWENPDDLREYIRTVAERRLPWRNQCFPNLREAMAERLFLGLRMNEGVDLNLFRDEFGISFEDAYPNRCSSLFSGRFLEICGGRLRLAEKSRLVSNQIFMRFL